MKNLFYTFALFMLITSCRTLEKMIERGQYDEAIIYATEKLAGKKKKKTKHVKALEEAFVKITQRDLDRLEHMQTDINPQNWEKVFDIAEKIQYRQNRIKPFLPLISKEGYQAHFDFVNTHDLKREATLGMAEHLYKLGSEELNGAFSSKDKRRARKAYDILSEASDWVISYKDTDELMDKALNYGKVNIKIELENNADVVVPKNFERIIKSIDIRDMNNIWKTYHMTEDADIDYDYIATLEITHIDVGPEQELVSQHQDEKEIKNGYRYLRNDKGEFVLDTAGQKIKVEKFKWVHAFVTEVERIKEANVSGQLFFMDTENNSVIRSVPIDVKSVFRDYASTYIGDRRALCAHDHSRLKQHPLPFPDDLELIMDASENLKEVFKQELRTSLI